MTHSSLTRSSTHDKKSKNDKRTREKKKDSHVSPQHSSRQPAQLLSPIPPPSLSSFFLFYTPIHITLTTTSIPFPSPPSYLKLHIPSLSLFQYAPLALCMPRLPTFLLIPSPLPSTSLSPSSPPARGSERCWMIVLLTANLYLLLGSAVLSSDEVLEVSEMSACRIFWMMPLFQAAVESCW